VRSAERGRVGARQPPRDGKQVAAHVELGSDRGVAERSLNHEFPWVLRRAALGAAPIVEATKPTY